VAGVVSYLGEANPIEGNRLVRTGSGVEIVGERDAIVRGNTVEDGTAVGIRSYLAIHELTMTDNHLVRCGYRGVIALDPGPAIGISALQTLGTVTVDSCHVIDTGETNTPNATPFIGIRYGVQVALAGSARVQGCLISSRALAKTTEVNFGSRAVTMQVLATRVIDVVNGKQVTAGPPIAGAPPSPGAFADAMDNVFEQYANVLVQVESGADVRFSNNRCTNSSPWHQNPSVELTGVYLIVIGNQVSAIAKTGSLSLSPSRALSAVGNVTTGGAVINLGTATEAPTPYTSFNVSI